MKKFLLLLSLSAFIVAGIFAAEEDSADETSNDTSIAGQEQADERTAEQPSAPPSPDEFIPSEEISEDYSVSFPVDI